MDRERMMEHEDGVVWLVDPATVPYVRGIFTMSPTRAGKPRDDCNGRMVGYTTLGPEARSNNRRFDRRVFYLSPWDRSEAADSEYRRGCPTEAVDPLTVKPGVWGEQTQRALEGQRCAACGRFAPLVDDECPDCRH